MSGVYSVEDLLKLRASPLICKPPNLPPIEEWMGSQEPVTKRPTTRGRADDSHFQTEGFQKRPTLDPSLRKSTTDPERIVLGPPRRSFASSNARNLGKVGVVDPEEIAREGGGRHERTRTGEDLENKNGDRKSGQFSGNSRYVTRHEQDHERARRRHEDDEFEGRPKKDLSRPRWSRDEKGYEETDENGGAKPGFKRDSQMRSRFEQSWLRTDRGTEEARRDGDRSGWRRDRVKDGDWDVPARGDTDPEWMDAAETAEPAQAHTQEDFQRWKERMKAAATGTVEEKPEIHVAIDTSTGSAKPAPGTPLSPPVGPTLNVNSMDKFFARFTEKRAVVDDQTSVTKTATKSKFASLFSPPPEAKVEAPPPPVVPSSPVAAPVPSEKPMMSLFDQAGSTTEADQAGFKRILEMLGKRDSTPAGEASKPKKIPDQLPRDRHQSPDLVALFKQNQPSLQAPSAQGPERLNESRSPVEGHRRQETPNKDELLLHLLRQAEISAKPSQNSPREYGQQSVGGLLAGMYETNRNEQRQLHEDHTDVDRQQQHQQLQQRGNARPLFDDPAISGYAYQDEMGHRQGTQRRLTNSYEDLYLDRQKSLQPPPGMVRPPGLEQVSRMPPGWSSQPPSQHQQPRPGPPPGINMPRVMQPTYTGSQQGPPPLMPQQAQRPAQRKYTGDSSAPNFPPGIGLPPGFMGNAPPPGFHHHNNNSNNNNSSTNQPQGYGRFAMGNDGQGLHQQGPPNMGRAFMEMYGNMDRSGLRNANNSGGVTLPPGFR